MDNWIPQTYTEDEWHRNNQYSFDQSDDSRANWFRIRQQGKQLLKDRTILTKAVQDAVTKKLVERANEIQERKRELEKSIEEINNEIKKLALLKQRLSKAYYETQTCLIVSNESLNVRSQRVLTDVVDDNVHSALVHEIQKVQFFQNIIGKYIKEVDTQIRKNQWTKVALQRDWSDKWEAYNIDTICSHMQDTSSDRIAFYGGPEKIPYKWSTPYEWDVFTREKLRASKIDVEESASLCKRIEYCLKEGSEDVRLHGSTVLWSLSSRIHQTTDALFLLKQNLGALGESIADAEKNIVDLKQAMYDGEPAWMKAQTRLHLRYERPNAELVKDPAHYALINESRHLAGSFQAVQDQLMTTESALKTLTNSRQAIEREIAIKQNSLLVDKTRCLKIRERLPTKEKLLGY